MLANRRDSTKRPNRPVAFPQVDLLNENLFVGSLGFEGPGVSDAFLRDRRRDGVAQLCKGFADDNIRQADETVAPVLGNLQLRQSVILIHQS